MNNSTLLPETQRPQEYDIPSGLELESYDLVTRMHLFEVASAIGVVPMGLSYRLYGQRVMWRMRFKRDPQTLPDEAKRVAWDIIVTALGGSEPKFYKSDSDVPDEFVGVWFTNGADRTIKITPF